MKKLLAGLVILLALTGSTFAMQDSHRDEPRQGVRDHRHDRAWRSRHRRSHYRRHDRSDRFGRSSRRDDRPPSR